MHATAALLRVAILCHLVTAPMGNVEIVTDSLALLVFHRSFALSVIQFALAAAANEKGD